MKLKYFIAFLMILILEILIAKYAAGFIRHTLGDYLCVILLYTLIKSIFKISNLTTAIIVLLIAYVVEFLQLTNLQNLYPSKYANTLKLILGTSFSIGDLIAYTLGILTVLALEKVLLLFRAKQSEVEKSQ